MFEQVREAAAPPALVLGADVEPLVHVDDRQLAIDVEDRELTMFRAERG